MYRPSDLKQFLNELGIHPKRSLSQNYLIDGNMIRKIAGAGGVTAGDNVLEIGPGPGALTQHLLELGANVIAIEKDYTLADTLKRLDPSGKRLTVYCEDCLTFPIESVVPKDGKLKVVSNIPYHLTTPILTRLAPRYATLSSLTLLVQDEVARRLTAPPGNKQYGSITVFLNYYSTAQYICKVSRHCFYPAPSVDSAIIHIALREPSYGVDKEQFFTMTRQAFSQRRKMLSRSLDRLYGSEMVKAALEACGYLPTVRPEELSLEAFICLFRALQSGSRPE